MNLYHVLRAASGNGWAVVRRTSLTRNANGNTVCEHPTRFAARKCCWGRNGSRHYASDVCNPFYQGGVAFLQQRDHGHHRAPRWPVGTSERTEWEAGWRHTANCGIRLIEDLHP